MTGPHASPAGLAAIADTLAARRPATGPLIVGVTGAVAAGKSTFAAQLKTALEGRPDRATVEIVGTDGFLMPNARLDALGLLDQKGFPSSYDTPALAAALTAIRTGPATFPAYSHVTYDIDPGQARTLAPPDVLIVEGLTLHHRALSPPPADPLDILIYLDADEAHLEAWFLARFMGLWAQAEHDPASFYARFRPMGREATEALARMVWEKVNLKNLRDHIVLARPGADLVVRKGEGHQIVAVEAAQRG